MKGIIVLIGSVYLFSVSCSNAEFTGDSENSVSTSVIEPIKKHFTPSELVQWVNEPKHGFIKEQRIENLSYSVLFKPADYIISIEQRSDSISSSVLKEKRNELSDLEYFELKISAKKSSGELLKYMLSSPLEYNSRIDYCSFKMERDIFMVVDSDTLPCSIFHFERAYDIAPYAKFLFAFKKNEKVSSNDRSIVFNDNLFQNGFIKFHFLKNVFSSVPSLEIL